MQLLKTKLLLFSGGNTKVFLGSGSTKKFDDDCDEVLIKSSQGSVQYVYISELMLWLHHDKLMDVK